MIRVESGVSDDWDGATDWSALADSAVRSAVLASRHARLAECGITVEVSVRFGSDLDVKGLNAAYRGKDSPTNVLSFPMFEPALIGSLADADGGEALLGDVILAQGVCTAEASKKGVKVCAHAAHLIVHGTLHLLGYDHETGNAEAEAMEETERRALTALGVADPYPVTEVQS
jgi:probable rRNA maturation factor